VICNRGENYISEIVLDILFSTGGDFTALPFPCWNRGWGVFYAGHESFLEYCPTVLCVFDAQRFLCYNRVIVITSEWEFVACAVNTRLG